MIAIAKIIYISGDGHEHAAAGGVGAGAGGVGQRSDGAEGAAEAQPEGHAQGWPGGERSGVGFPKYFSFKKIF